ncbi:MAG: hypothetical protein WD065_06920 [Planctomycetaceae bacterium]
MTISILLILAVITLATVNMTQTYDRIRAGARQVQSYYEGAKSRAAYAKDARGIRFLLDTADNTTASSMVFIGPPERFSQGTVTVLREDVFLPVGSTAIAAGVDLNLNGINDVVNIAYPPIWNNLAIRNRLSDGARIELPRNSGNYYTIAKSVNSGLLNQWYLTRGYPDSNPTLVPGPGQILEYSLELNPAVLPNQEPRPLGTGIVIDLDNSRIPGTWRTGGVGSAYTQQLDVLFTPRGTVTGASAGDGTIHLVLAAAQDTVNNIPPGAGTWQNSTAYTVGQWVKPTLDNACLYLCTSGGTSGGTEPIWPTKTGNTISDGAITWECYQVSEKLLVSLFTHTGRVSTHAVSTYEPIPGVVDIFREAELGREIR